MFEIKTPGKYIQGASILNDLGKIVSGICDKFLIITDPFSWSLTREKIDMTFSENHINYVQAFFGGECTEAEAKLMAATARKNDCIGIIGIGGGKILDTAKAASEFAKMPVVIIPTAASSDAPCSSVAVLYHNDHSFDRYMQLSWGPELVVVDTSLIVNAPARLLAAGMADALSTYIENSAYQEGVIKHNLDKPVSESIMQLSKLCYDTILSCGKKAFDDVSANLCSNEVERVVEANIYMSGIGFNNGALAAAHSIANALTHISGLNLLHGEAVSIGLVAQLQLEQRPEEEIQQIREFLISINLPTHLKDLPVTFSKDILINLADTAAHSYDTNSYLPFSMDEESLIHVLS